MCYYYITANRFVAGGLQVDEDAEFDNPSLPHYNSAMNTPFPGMDPYLEHPTLWADVHDTAPPTPPLAPDDAQWAQTLLAV